MKKGRIDFLLIFATFCIGIYIVPLQMMHFNLSFIPGDLGDTRLNNYFLEHGFKWVTGQVENFWSAPFFYPVVRTIALSDNHLGTLPIYVLFRFLHFDRETSYQLWFLVIFSLNYFSCAWVLKKFSINALGTAVGAFIFTFSLPVIARLGHSQLLPRYMIPLAFYFTFSYLEKPDVKTFFLICLSVVIQFYCTVYMGFFLILGICSLFISFNLFKRDLKKLRDLFGGSYRTITVKLLIILLSIAALLPLMVPYYRTALEYGQRSWNEILQILPRINSYFYPVNGTLLWSWLSPVGSKLPLFWEHQIFVGAIPLAAFIVLPFLYFRYRKEMMFQRGIISFGSVVILILLTLSFRSSFSIYKLITLLPGGRAIRAVTRIILMNLFFFSFGVAIVLTKITERNAVLSRLPVKVTFSLFILFIVILDQKVLPDHYGTYSKYEAQNRSKAVEKLVIEKDEHKKIFAYMPIVSTDPDYVVHLDAMLAAQNLNMATVNGYSGNVPLNYDFYNYNNCDSLLKWQQFSTQRYSKYYDVENLFEDFIVVGRDGCKGSDRSYTIMTAALPEDEFRAKITSPSFLTASRNSTILVQVRLENMSSTLWRALSGEKGNKYKIGMSYRWISSDDVPLGGFDSRIALPYDLQPRESTTIDVTIRTPAEPGIYYIEFSLVQELIAWFHDKGSKTSRIKLIVF